MVRFLLGLAFWGSAIGLILGFFGALHPAGDSISLFRPILAPVLAVAALGMFFDRRRPLGLLGLIGALAVVATLIPPALAPDERGDAEVLSLYQKNLLFRLPDTAPVVEDILATDADFVTLQELHQNTRGILRALSDTYPTQHFCPFAAVGGIAVLSRWPARDGRTLCAEGAGMAAVEVDAPDGPLWVVSLHLHWPYPYRQAEQLAELEPMLTGFDGQVLLGGDFNMVPWSHAVRSVSRSTNTRNSGFAGGTFALSYTRNGQNLARLFPRLPIDHILVPAGAKVFEIERRDRLGSDHHGVLVRFLADSGN